MMRKITTTAKNGSSGSPSLSLTCRRFPPGTSADRLGPVVRQILGGLLGLVRRRDDDRAIDDRQLSSERLIEGTCGHHVVGPHRPDTACGEQILALVAVEELLPQARGRGMRGVLVD